jgi:hypothetical protein
MPRFYIKKQPAYLEKDMLAAMKLIMEDGWPLATAGKKFGIARTTLQGAMIRLKKQMSLEPRPDIIGPLERPTVDKLPDSHQIVSVNYFKTY